MNSFINAFFNSDTDAIILCDLNHVIVAMNPAAIEHFQLAGGKELVGKNLLDCHNMKSQEKIKSIVNWFLKDESNNLVHTYYDARHNKEVYMVALRNEEGSLIGYYEKHEPCSRDESSCYDY